MSRTSDRPLLEGVDSDPTLLEELATREELTRVEEPELSDWIADLQAALLDAMGGLLGDAAPWEELLSVGFWLLLAVVGLTLAVLLGRAVRAHFLSSAEEDATRTVELVARRGVGVGEDPWARFARCHEAGDAKAALTALWDAVVDELSGVGLGTQRRELSHRGFVRSVAQAEPAWVGLRELRALAQEIERLQFDGAVVTMKIVDGLEPRARDLVIEALQHRKAA